MVQISHETLEETDIRLRRVIAEADFRIYEGTFAFEEFPLGDFQSNARPDALALVRDDEVWSQLIPFSDKSQELFSIFSFHFAGCADNSGFVGWLASHLKAKLGTGEQRSATCHRGKTKSSTISIWKSRPWRPDSS